jgi:coenzyme PQQ precursor peptide PqqA
MRSISPPRARACPGIPSLALAVVGYALSPIDLIPDFIPVLGYVDDLILVPLGIWLVLSLIPEEVMIACRARADEAVTGPHGKTAAIVIIAIWILGGAVVGWSALAYWRRTHQVIAGVHCAMLRTCAVSIVVLGSSRRGVSRQTWENEMTWKAPKIVEVPVGMEINMYACAARK